MQRFALELKVWRPGRPDPVEAGLEQLNRYLERLGLDNGTLVLFDQRPDAPPFAGRRSSAWTFFAGSKEVRTFPVVGAYLSSGEASGHTRRNIQENLMNTNSFHLILTHLAVAATLGTSSLQGQSPSAPAPQLGAGAQVRIAPTVAGFGASLLRRMKDPHGIKVVTVIEVREDGRVVEWWERVREETEESRHRRDELKNHPPVVGVGEAEPEPPAAEYAERIRRGRITATGLSASRTMTLPALLPEGDQAVEGTSLIWLSPVAFRELRSTRETRWSFGLLDSPLLQPVALVGGLRRALDALRKRLETEASAAELEDYRRIEAEPDFSSFELEVDGRRVKVRTIVARNWFGELVILDDENNPLVLKATLNPLSGGALDVFSPLGALKALAGYQVLSIDSADG